MAVALNLPQYSGSNSTTQVLTGALSLTKSGTYLADTNRSINIGSSAAVTLALIILEQRKYSEGADSSSTKVDGSSIESQNAGGVTSDVRVTVNPAGGKSVTTSGSAEDGDSGKDLYVDLVDGTTGWFMMTVSGGDATIIAANNVEFSKE